MEAKITVQVHNYRLIFPNGQSQFVLQSPISSKGRCHHGSLLVRQDQGANNNQVRLEPQSTNLAEDNNAQQSAFAHGILLQSNQTNLEGDQVWLAESASKTLASRLDTDTIEVFNLRTWKRLTVFLDEVCWIPKYRKRDCGDREQFLTISGPPVRRPNKKWYILAIVQHLHKSNDAAGADAEIHVEARELVEQETFRYDNLTQKPEGKRIIEELVRRSLAIKVRKSTFRESGIGNPIAAVSQGSAPGLSVSVVSKGTVSAFLTSSPKDGCSSIDEEDDLILDQNVRAIMDKVRANLTSQPQKPVCPTTTLSSSKQCISRSRCR